MYSKIYPQIILREGEYIGKLDVTKSGSIFDWGHTLHWHGPQSWPNICGYLNIELLAKWQKIKSSFLDIIGYWQISQILLVIVLDIEKFKMKYMQTGLAESNFHFLWDLSVCDFAKNWKTFECYFCSIHSHSSLFVVGSAAIQ